MGKHILFFWGGGGVPLPVIDLVGWGDLLVRPSPEPSLYTDRLQVGPVAAVEVAKPGSIICFRKYRGLQDEDRRSLQPHLPDVQVYVRLRESSQF